MKTLKTPIEGLLVFIPNVFSDERGSFFESWSKKYFKEIKFEFVQDNQSSSKKGVLRGLHFQNPPYEQGKLVRVIKGAVIDVAVDIRKGSVTYGKHFSIKLSEKNKKIFWIPPGFAHGFLSIVDDTVFSYKCTNIYNKQSEGSLLWNDTDLDIDWGITKPLVSAKDMCANHFKDFESKF